MAGTNGQNDMMNKIEFERGPAKINLNTMVVVGGFLITIITMVFTGGIKFSAVNTGIENNKNAVAALSNRVSTVETVQRTVDNHELRIKTMEAQMLDSIAGIRAMETSMSQLSSDIRVVREILQRLESKSDADRRGPP